MAILVTRPAPDNETTAAALRARGLIALLSPMLRFESIAPQDDDEADYDGLVVTSANAVRALGNHPAPPRWLELPLFAVGDRTADVAREAGFRNVVSAQGDAVALRDLLAAQVAAKKLKKRARLCYLAGADRARDLAAELAADGFAVMMRTVYRMVPLTGFPVAVDEAFRAGQVDAVLHYSRRSARAFLDASRAAGVEISALALPQCCISDAVAAVLREAGAMQVTVARTPDENAVLEALDRAIKPSSK